ncbi:hypothetical protein BN1723_009839 [Verticillium longisporum]|uniref:Uncharacterized protein n=1 Tax=Verticillium longisporum TaxID=100787 RepID=A0A0G4KT36_VERLO|nr:hypothetical protein BN1723_009839 [Verticillium longisporum]
MPARRVVEAHLQTRRRVRGHEHKVGVRLHNLRQVGGDVKGVVNLLLEPGGAVVDPREGQLEAVAAAAALQRQVGKVPHVVRLVDAVEQVAGRQRVGLVEHGEVVGQEERARDGDVEHLVGVDGQRIGKFDAGELALLLRREDDGPAPAAIDVQPESKLLADLGNLHKGVKGPHDRGAGRGIDVEGRLALVPGLDDELAQRLGDHATLRVDGDGPDVGGAEAARQRALLDRVVTVGAGEEDECVRPVAVCPRLGVQAVAGDDDRGHVGGAAALARDAAGAGAGKAKDVGKATGRDLLNDAQSRRHLVHMKIRVENRQDEISNDTDRRVGGVQLVQKSLVPCVDAVLKDLLEEGHEAVLAETFTVWQGQLQPRHEFLRLERAITSNDDRGHVGGAAALARDAAGAGAGKAKDVGKATGRDLLNDAQSRRHLVHMKIRVENGQDEIGNDTDRRVGGVQLVQESLIPRVDAVLKDLLDEGHEAVLAETFAVWQGQLQPRDEFLRLERVDEDIGGQTIRIDRYLAVFFERRSIVGSSDVRDDQVPDGIEELGRVSRESSRDRGPLHSRVSTYILDLIGPVQSRRGMVSVAIGVGDGHGDYDVKGGGR